MHGLGNDFVLVDGVRGEAPPALERIVREVCDRRTGVGADGVLLVGRDERASARMTIWNADGSRAGMCGNGLRCVTRWLLDEGVVKDERFTIATDSGVLDVARARLSGGGTGYRTAVGAPSFERGSIPMHGREGPVLDEPFEAAGRSWRLSAMRLGNPHAVVFVDDPARLDLDLIGPSFERHPSFPERTNTSFVSVVSRHLLRQRTFERGVGETRACGT